MGIKTDKNMKKNIFAWAVGSLLLLSTSCADDEIINNVTPAVDGSEVIFGARAGFENGKPDSRTEYSGVEYTYNGKSYERIDWVFDTDKVEIYCPQGANTKNSHYYVRNASIAPDNKTPNANTETDHLNDYSYLERISTESSIQWNGDGVHEFYAMYPSSMMFTENPDKTLETGVYLNNTTVTGVVPFSQQPLEVTGSGHYVAKPNMDYAYMVAKSQATRKDASGKDASVDLTFVPIVTAVEMTLQYPENGTSAIHIGEIQVTSSQPITGKFTADLAGWNPAEGYPTCTNDANNVIETIQITTRIKNGNTYEPIKLDKGNTLTFTVFLLPGSNVEDLTVRLSDTGAGYASKKMTFTGTKIIKKNVKNIVTGVNLPAPLIVNATNWMVRIDDEGEMGRLSLPGTGNSFSYLSEEDEYYKSQLITFADQWNLGVRAFEITTDRPEAGTTTLGNQPVMCNAKAVTGLNVRGAFDLILDTNDDDDPADGLIGPKSTETAMIILTYQPGGDNAPGRDPSVFMQSLNVLYDELVTAYGDRFVLYSPNLTMAQARGKIMIVVRPTQLDEDDATSRSNALTAVGSRSILVVDGCGTGKDKWGRRGYKINGTLAADIKDCATGAPLFETYLLGTYTSGWLSGNNLDKTSWADWTTNKVELASSDYSYGTQQSGYSIWFQEWARVVENDLKINLSSGVSGINKTSYCNCYWRESYNEKKNAVFSTFDMAISDNYKDSYVFINSLCGYFVDSSKKNSYAPYMDKPNTGIDLDSWTVGGQCGKIGDLATVLNRDFYNHVLEVGLDNKTGPTGVVLMERLSKSASDGGSHYLPGTIIANNFKYGSASDNLGGNTPPTKPDKPEIPEEGGEG